MKLMHIGQYIYITDMLLSTFKTTASTLYKTALFKTIFKWALRSNKYNITKASEIDGSESINPYSSTSI